MKSLPKGKRNRQLLPEESERFFTLSIDMLCVAGFDGYFRLVNPAWEATLGFTVAEMLARPFIDFIHPNDREPTNAAYATQIQQGKDVVEFENRYLCKDGTYRRLLWNAKTVAEDGLIYAVARDVTERSRMEQTLREAVAKMNAIVGTAVDGIITIDERGTVATFNPAAERIFGYEASEVIGRNVSMLMPAPYRDEHDGYVAHYLETGEERVIGNSREVVGQRKDGTTFPMDLAVSEVGLHEPRVFTGIVRDITERKRAEEELARRADELAASNAELEDFTHVVSHDLKEPMRGIEAFSGFLAEDYAEQLDEQGQRYVAVLRDSAVRMRDLIDDLLQLSRIGRTKPQLATVEVGTLLEEISRSMAFALKEKGAKLRLAGALPAIVCDPVRIRQVFENLVSNAVKYNDKPEPVVEIGCREDEGGYTFYVRDNGAGVDQRYHEKIFRIFQRLVLREEHEGTGVGLTICKKIVEAHGGRIWIESEGNGQGSTFLFTIPMTLKPSVAAKEARNGKRTGAGPHSAGRGQPARRGDNEEGAGEGADPQPLDGGAGRARGARHPVRPR